MKRSQAFPSRFLGKEDVVTPIRATIGDVAQEDVNDEGRNVKKTVMLFRESNVKPLILNGCNWQTCEDAYGEDSDDWRGKVVEIFVDPSVMFGRERVGGVRIRIPVTAPIQQNRLPSNGANGNAKPRTLEEKHLYVLKAYGEAQDDGKIQTICQWASKQSFSPHQEEEQVGARMEAMERISQASGPVHREEEIPF